MAEGDIDLLVFNKFFKSEKNGVFVDVGAAGPDYLSISAFYRNHGWRVVCIEPNPEFAEMHRSRGNEIFEYACGEKDIDEVAFSIADSHGSPYENGSVSYESFSSFALKPGFRELLPETVTLREVKVKVRRLDGILSEAGVKSVDILSIDVEGWELEVLAGLDFKKNKPKVVIIENLLDSPLYRATMRGYGYLPWRKIALNEVYVLPEMLALFERLAARVGSTKRKLREIFGARSDKAYEA